MAAPLAEELERLLNPLPDAQEDPEDDPQDATAARIIDKFDEGIPDDDVFSIERIRGGTSLALLDADKRYHGKATSRKALEEELWEEDQLSDEESPGGKMTDEEDLDSEPLEENLDAENPEIELDEEGEEEKEEEEDAGLGSSQDRIREASEKQKSPAFTFQAVDDFEKFAEGMDEEGSTGEEEEEEEDEDENYSTEEGSEGEESAQETEERRMDVNKSKDDGPLLTFSKEDVTEEVEKGKALKNQIALWDQLLEGRIKLQKVLLTVNQLPQPDTFPEFKKRGGQEFADALKNNYKALKALLRSLVFLQDELLHQYSGTRHLVDGRQMGKDSDEEIPSESDGEGNGEEGETRKRARQRAPKRKLEMGDYPEFAAKRFAAFRDYRNSTLQKWHEKTKMASGKLGKDFGAFERSILTQIDNILMDKERLVRRTQTKRSTYRVLGKRQRVPELLPEALPGQTEVLPSSVSNTHLKDLDEEIFDDDDFYHQVIGERNLGHIENQERHCRHPPDFYKHLDQDTEHDDWKFIIHPVSQTLESALERRCQRAMKERADNRIKSLIKDQLLRELIERKTSSLDPNDQVAMGRQWLAIQKLRSKIRKKVDTKASKGRKIRYHVHSKLVSFMAPIDHCTMNDDARTELYRSLFGKQTPLDGRDHP